MERPDESDWLEDVDQGTDALSTSPTPGDLDALDDHGKDDQNLDEFPVPSEGAPSGVTGLVVGEPETPDR